MDEEVGFSPDNCKVAYGKLEFRVASCQLCMCYVGCITRGIIKRYVTFDGENWHEKFILVKLRTDVGLIDHLLHSIIDEDPKRAMDIITALFAVRGNSKGHHTLRVFLRFNYEVEISVRDLGDIVNENSARKHLKRLEELGLLECDNSSYPYIWTLRESA